MRNLCRFRRAWHHFDLGCQGVACWKLYLRYLDWLYVFCANYCSSEVARNIAVNTDRLRKIARFRLLASQHAGVKMDLVRFHDEEEYAKHTITAVLAMTEHEELTVLALELLDHVPAISKPKAAAPNPAVPADAINNKYIGRLR